MKYVSFLFFALILAGCHKGSTVPTEQNCPKIGEAFDLRIGEFVFIKNEIFSFQFMNVFNDSRCPEGARCIWGGNAMVLIKVFAIQDTLNTNVNPREITYDLYKITLLELSPYPKVGVPRDTTQYSGKFMVTKK